MEAQVGGPQQMMLELERTRGTEGREHDPARTGDGDTHNGRGRDEREASHGSGHAWTREARNVRWHRAEMAGLESRVAELHGSLP